MIFIVAIALLLLLLLCIGLFHYNFGLSGYVWIQTLEPQGLSLMAPVQMKHFVPSLFHCHELACNHFAECDPEKSVSKLTCTSVPSIPVGTFPTTWESLIMEDRIWIYTLALCQSKHGPALLSIKLVYWQRGMEWRHDQCESFAYHHFQSPPR